MTAPLGVAGQGTHTDGAVERGMGRVGRALKDGALGEGRRTVGLRVGSEVKGLPGALGV